MNWLQPHYNKNPPMAGKNKNAVASSDPKSHSPQENIWFGFRQTQQKMTATPSNLEKSRILEHFYLNARTHFSKNQQISTDVKWRKEDNLRNQPRRLPAKGWPAPRALTFAFFGFPPAEFLFCFRKKSGLSGRLPKTAERRCFISGNLLKWWYANNSYRVA